jgi:hypothetical protein
MTAQAHLVCTSLFDKGASYQQMLACHTAPQDLRFQRAAIVTMGEGIDGVLVPATATGRAALGVQQWLLCRHKRECTVDFSVVEALVPVTCS